VHTRKTEFRKIETPRPVEMDSLNTARLRECFLLERIFEPGKGKFFLTDLDRLLVAGIAPATDFALPEFSDLGGGPFLDRREAGIINLGEAGRVTVGDESVELGHLECLYIGRGEVNVVFHPSAKGTARYYMLSCPAHAKYPTRKASRADARVVEVGTAATCSSRSIFQYIYPGGVESAQLVMGFTQLNSGNAWNTMPAHTHGRRTEVYFYFDLGEGIVVHLLGEPPRTRHIIVHDGEAVLSPSWSIHSGAGTSNYGFVWGMAGENQEFDDMDPVSMREMA
jgi:4-deoxy-L-threo-5-hexosulose-uronate ketol-isomerase